MGYILSQVFSIYSWALVLYCIFSWLPIAAVQDIREAMAPVCEPYLGLFRKLIPPVGMMDFSPVVALIVLQVLERFVLRLF